MPKIVFIGAGSFGFTRNLVRDLLTFDRLRNAEIALVDINKQRLDFARRACRKLIDQGGYGATVTATTDRRQVLSRADAVCITILRGATRVWQHDILIPKKYGIDTNVGDTRGPSGIFRALRTIPEMLAIARDMEELCPAPSCSITPTRWRCCATPCNARPGSSSPDCATPSRGPPPCSKAGWV